MFFDGFGIQDALQGISKQKVEEDSARPINRQPWAIKKAAVSKDSILKEKNQNFPEETANRSQKKEEYHLGD